MAGTKYFVTLFNSNYMSRGLVMYESLKREMGDFHLYIIAFDDKARGKLAGLGLDRATVISLEEFEDESLLRVKGGRTAAEYCWTCSSKSILYVMERFKVEECTYIDADLCFFSDPAALTQELGEDGSVLLTAHRYSKYCDQTAESGKYCVQFVTVKGDGNGMEALRWWAQKCLEWCYARVEETRFGDQKYLDFFHEKFRGVRDLTHLGGGVAPWNVSQYSFYEENGRVFMRERATGSVCPLVFYHFHGMDFFNKDVIHLTCNEYIIPDTAIACIYKKYVRYTECVCRKYGLRDGAWRNEQAFRDDDLDKLEHEKNYYQKSLFL